MELYAFPFLYYRYRKQNRQTVITMKLLCLLLIATFFKTHAGGFAQTIDLSVDQVSLETVFKEIKKQTGYRFIYMKEQLRATKPVSIHVQKAGLKQVLDLCFYQQPFRYVIEDRYIIVQPLKEEKIETDKKQLIDIRGRVVDERGDAVSGVTVKIKDTNTATATDADGMFQFKGIEDGSVLLFSGTNVEDYTFRITDNKDLIIRLKTKIGKLDEVQVIAYGSTTQRMNTGNVSKISSSVIERQPVANPVAALQGRAAGVFVTTQNGMPGGNVSVQIRGKGSINAGTDPLYVIDGVPFGSTPLSNGFNVLSTGINGAISPLNSINPSDIESIEILKDADATAIYGSRAANGVVLITTKKGKAGKTRFDVSVYTGFNEVSAFPAMLGLSDYLRLRREGFTNDNVLPTTSNAYDLLVWDTTKGTDWADYILGGRASVTNVQLSVSGGNEQTNFRIGGNYRKEGTVLPGHEVYQRGGAHFVLQHQTSDHKFQVTLKSSYSTDDNNLLASSVFSILTLPPNLPMYDQAGNYNWTGINDVNPAAVLKQTSNSKAKNLLTNLLLQYDFGKGVRFKTSIGYQTIDLDQVMLFPKATINPLIGSESTAHYGDNRNSVFSIEPQLEYTHSFQYSTFSVLTGAAFQNNVREGSLVTGKNYSNENLLAFAGAAGTISATNSYSQYKYASLFSRVHYDYKEKYLLNVNFRRDGSSRFGPGKRFGNFGSVGAAWVFNREVFFKDISFVSYGKLRASFGLTGNDLIPGYQYLSTYGTNGTNYQGVTGLAPTRTANANFGWESNRKFEAALEAGFLKNRILFNLVYYQHRSGNQLIDYPLPYTSGPFGSYLANLPALIENRGWEFDFTTTVIRNEKISLSVTGNISLPKNELLKYPGLASSSFAYTYVIGEDLSIRKTLHFTGINTQTGLPEYEDVNKDGVVSLPGDYVIAGKTSPDYYGGFGTEFRYKQFELSLFFQYSKQFATGSSTIAGTRSNKFAIAMSRWQKPGDITTIGKAAVTVTSAYTNLAQSDAVFYNATYLRFKNISAAYQLPTRIISRLKLQQIRFYLEAQNLFTWRRQGNLYDPETANTGIAPMKTIAAGIQLNF